MHVNIDLSCLLHACMRMYSRMAAAAVLACDSACASSTLQVMVASVALLYKWLRQ
eukprot:COSAG05_NODE_1776_length_4111_cov_87.186174_3_plen_55_part_00